MRKSLVAGNWKMNKTIAETRDLVFKMSSQLREINGAEKVICPPFMSLMAASASARVSDWRSSNLPSAAWIILRSLPATGRRAAAGSQHKAPVPNQGRGPKPARGATLVPPAPAG